jgi:hypothetical protein
MGHLLSSSLNSRDAPCAWGCSKQKAKLFALTDSEDVSAAQ